MANSIQFTSGYTSFLGEAGELLPAATANSKGIIVITPDQNYNIYDIIKDAIDHTSEIEIEIEYPLIKNHRIRKKPIIKNNMKDKFKRLSTIILFLLFFCSIGYSQSVKRQSIGCYGAGGMIDGFFVSQTIGQPFFTSGHSDHVITISPGFQQPVTYMTKKVKTITEHSLLEIFPNPASDHFFIETSEQIESAVIRITDLNGRVVLQEILPNIQQHLIRSSHLQDGLYFIHVQSDNNKQNNISKIIISK